MIKSLRPLTFIIWVFNLLSWVSRFHIISALVYYLYRFTLWKKSQLSMHSRVFHIPSIKLVVVLCRNLNYLRFWNDVTLFWHSYQWCSKLDYLGGGGGGGGAHIPQYIHVLHSQSPLKSIVLMVCFCQLEYKTLLNAILTDFSEHTQLKPVFTQDNFPTDRKGQEGFFCNKITRAKLMSWWQRKFSCHSYS